MTRRYCLTDQNGRDITEELLCFAETIGLEKAASGRYSIALLLGLFGGFATRTQNPWKVVQEIEALEGLRSPTRTKPAEPFKRTPLKGLMHKHHLADGLSSLTRNLKNEIDYSGLPLLKQRIAEAQALGEERYFTVEDASWIAHEVSVGSYERRSNRGVLTGEWIVYAQHESRNFYLCLGRHDSGDGELKRQIEAVCCKEFPFLQDLFAAASNQNVAAGEN